MKQFKTLYARIWAPIFLLCAWYFFPKGEHAHHMMGQDLFGLPEMTWMWILMAFAHVHLFWGCECDGCCACNKDGN